MRLAVLQHIACEHPGVFSEVIAERGVEAVAVELDEGEPLPRLARLRRRARDGRADGRRRRGRAPVAGGREAVGPRGGGGRPAVPRRLPRRAAARRGARRPRLRGAGARGRACSTSSSPRAGRDDPLFAGLDDPIVSLQWHGDTFDLPEGAVRLASSPLVANQAFRAGEARLRRAVPPRGDGRDGARVGRDPGLPRFARPDARGARRRRVHRRRRSGARTSCIRPRGACSRTGSMSRAPGLEPETPGMYLFVQSPLYSGHRPENRRGDG